jgi:hypothetical protein
LFNLDYPNFQAKRDAQGLIEEEAKIDELKKENLIKLLNSISNKEKSQKNKSKINPKKIYIDLKRNSFRRQIKKIRVDNKSLRMPTMKFLNNAAPYVNKILLNLPLQKFLTSTFMDVKYSTKNNEKIINEIYENFEQNEEYFKYQKKLNQSYKHVLSHYCKYHYRKDRKNLKGCFSEKYIEEMDKAVTGPNNILNYFENGEKKIFSVINSDKAVTDQNKKKNLFSVIK